MTKQSAFNKESLKNITPHSRSIMEELNLPPRVISFLEDNAKNIMTAAICIAVLAVGWVAYNHYREVRADRSTAMLAKAMHEQNEVSRHAALQKLTDKYPGTKAALWARLEMAHDLNKSGKTQEAVKAYKAVLDDIEENSSLVPLVKYDLALALESGGQLDESMTQYQQLKELSGFTEEGSLGMGRIYERKGLPMKAKDIYKTLLADESLAEQTRLLVEAKLANLEEKPASMEEQPADKVDTKPPVNQ